MFNCKLANGRVEMFKCWNRFGILVKLCNFLADYDTYLNFHFVRSGTVPAASCTRGTSLLTGAGVAITGVKVGALLVGTTMPLLTPRLAVIKEYETQDGESRNGREERGGLTKAGGKEGAWGIAAAGGALWVKASSEAEGTRQPGECEEAGKQKRERGKKRNRIKWTKWEAEERNDEMKWNAKRGHPDSQNLARWIKLKMQGAITLVNINWQGRMFNSCDGNCYITCPGYLWGAVQIM